MRPRLNPNVNLNFADVPDLFTALNIYRISKGWTWKRLFLIGVAEAIAKEGDNPDLVLKIVEVLEARR